MPDFSAVIDEIHRQVSEGLRPAISVVVNLAGETVLDHSEGRVTPNGPEIGPYHLFPIFSATKPIVALAIHRLVEEGKLSYTDRVAEHFPEFGKHGKERVTLLHVLTHQGGFPDKLLSAGGESLRETLGDYEAAIERLCEMKLQWEPGERRAYHGLSGWYVLGELIHRLSGTGIENYVRESVLAPCGIERFFFAVPESERDNVLPLSNIRNPRWSDRWNDSDVLGSVVPGGGGRTTAGNLVRFYRMLLNGGEGPNGRVVSKDRVRLITFPHVAGFIDPVLRADIPWGLGLKLKSAWGNPDFFGSRATPGSYGHLGHVAVTMAFADPGRDAAIAILTNGLHPMERGTELLCRIADRIHEAIDRR